MSTMEMVYIVSVVRRSGGGIHVLQAGLLEMGLWQRAMMLEAMSVLPAVAGHEAQGSSTCCVIPQHGPPPMSLQGTERKTEREPEPQIHNAVEKQKKKNLIEGHSEGTYRLSPYETFNITQSKILAPPADPDPHQNWHMYHILQQISS